MIRATIAASFVAGAALAAGACGSDSEAERVRGANVKQGCLINSDCQSPLKCAFQRCHTECDDQRDCKPGELCVPSDRPYKVCMFQEEKHCAYHSDCPEGFVCSVDQTCRPQCRSVRDCVSGQVCVDGVCAVSEELVNGSLPPAADAAVDSNEGKACVYNSDCPPPLVCRADFCLKECRTDRDCGSGQRCSEEGSCVPLGSDGGADAGSEPDASSDGGAEGGAVPDCSNGLQDPGESGVDCGGPCGACPAAGCSKPSDCASRVCVAQTCQAPSCIDKLQNGAESDIDCGGGTCPKCSATKGCWTTGDCVTGSCVSGVCTAPGCQNLIKDTNETDIDCGGSECGPCANGRACSVNLDCVSQNCVARSCVPAGPTTWVKALNTSANDHSLVAVDRQGNVIAASLFGGTFDFGGGPLQGDSADIFLGKYTPAGAHVWSRRFGGNGADDPVVIGADANGDVLLAGTSVLGGVFGGTALSCNTGLVIAKYAAADGAHRFSRCIGSAAGGTMNLFGGVVDSAGDLIVGGEIVGTYDFGGGQVFTSSYYNGFLAKFSGVTGATVWLKQYKHPTSTSNRATVRAVTAIGTTLYVVGDFTNAMDFGGGVSLSVPVSVGNLEIFMLIVGSDGVPQRGRRLGDSGNDSLLAVSAAGAQEIVAAGYFGSQVDFGGPTPLQAVGQDDILIMKISASDLSTVWAKGFGSAATERPNAISVASNGEIAVTGYMTSAVNFGGGPLTYVGDDDMFLLRLAAAGTHLRSESHGSLGADRGTSLAYAGTVLAFGGYYNSGIIDLGTGPLPDGSGYDAFVAYLTQ